MQTVNVSYFTWSRIAPWQQIFPKPSLFMRLCLLGRTFHLLQFCVGEATFLSTANATGTIPLQYNDDANYCP